MQGLVNFSDEKHFFSFLHVPYMRRISKLNMWTTQTERHRTRVVVELQTCANIL